MVSITYGPEHGSNKRRSDSKRLCRQCRALATHAEVRQRPAALLRLDGTVHRFVEECSTYWCTKHTGMTGTRQDK